jgi:glyoxylase I family protein
MVVFLDLLDDGAYCWRMLFEPHHVGISVTDLNASLKFYERFGFQERNHWTSDDGEIDIVHMQLGSYLLELFAYKNHHPAPESMSTLAVDIPTIGTKHHGVRVEDIDAAHAWAKAEGLTPESDVLEGRTGVRYFFVRDPSGNFFELAEDNRPFLAPFQG